MSFTTFTNIITILFCLAVLVQSVRMMRSLKQVREGRLDHIVSALETATAQAHSVLSELKRTLSTDGADNARTLSEAKEIREELSVMIGIANAMAERLVEAATSSTSVEQPTNGTVSENKPEKTAKKIGIPAVRKRTPAKPAANGAKGQAKQPEPKPANDTTAKKAATPKPAACARKTRQRAAQPQKVSSREPATARAATGKDEPRRKSAAAKVKEVA